MPTLFGPRRIAANGQIVVPREAMRLAGLEPGDTVYFRFDPRHKTISLLASASIDESIAEVKKQPRQPKKRI
jgi:bifunctional DNA-binding transcriptional regulator/antitoxin component of YhaV-PrlF toxin-antitoxin module